jgi:hypothetical protein
MNQDTFEGTLGSRDRLKSDPIHMSGIPSEGRFVGTSYPRLYSLFTDQLC